MLKSCNIEEKENFALRVISFINPKFDDYNELNPYSDFNIAKAELMDFCSKCVLTSSEFMIALDMASRRKLFLNGETVKLFREIDRIKLGEVENAYLEFRRNDKDYDRDYSLIKTFLEKPSKEITEEDKKAERKKNLISLMNSIEKGEKCNHAFLFYDFVVRKGGLKSFINDTDAQKSKLNEKMMELLMHEKRKEKSSLFSRFEILELEKLLEGKESKASEFSLNALSSKAIIEVKNDLVYNWFKSKMKK